MKKIFVVSTLLAVSACMTTTTEHTPQTASSLRDGTGYGTLCYAIETARSFGTSASLDVLMAEYQRRNPNISQRWLGKLRNGYVATGMPESVAVCSWNATLVNHSIGYGTNSKQYQGAGSYSFFFVNGRTGKVEFISA